MSTLVSIVIPIYNMADKIEKCVESVLSQSYTNIEVILVDDGSKDSTYEVCKGLQAKDNRIKLIHTENRGSGPARNTGIENSHGEYIYFPDADDLVDKEAISTAIKAAEDNKCDLVVFGFRKVNQEGKTTFEKKYEPKVETAETIRSSYIEYMGTYMKYGIQGAPWNKFFSRKIISDNNVSFPPLRRHQDEGFIGNYMCHSEKVCFIAECLYTHYVNSLKNEWDKYPVTYIDSVMGLYESRKRTILTWNPNDNATREWIEKEYICNVIKALELSFSTKMGLTSSTRKTWIAEAIKKTKIEDMEIPEILGKYQRLIMGFVKKHKNKMLYIILNFKVNCEKLGVLEKVK